MKIFYLLLNISLLFCSSLSSMEQDPFLDNEEHIKMEGTADNQDARFIEFSAACSGDNLNSLNSCIEKNADFLKNNLNTAVHIAMQHNKLYALSLLRKHNCFKDCKCENIFSFLLASVESDKFDYFMFFLNNINEKDANFLTFKLARLVFALIQDDNSNALELLKNHYYFARCSRESLLAFLRTASDQGKIKCFSFLLNYLIEANPDLIKETPRQTIFWAIKSNNRKDLVMLKDHHFFDNCSEQDILEFLDLAKRYDKEVALNFFLENCKEKEPLNENLNQSNKVELHFEGQPNKTESTKTEKTEPIPFRSSKSRNPLGRQFSLINLIKGVSTSYDPNYERSIRMPRNILVKKEQTSEKEHDKFNVSRSSSLDSDRSMNASHKNGMTGLMIAAQNGCYDLLSDMLKRGDNPNESNDGGDTPLIYAAHAISPECVKHLLESNANPLAANYEGKTALSILAEMSEQNLYSKIRRICLDNMAKNMLEPYAEKSETKETESNEKDNSVLYTNLFNKMSSIEESDPCPLTDLLQKLESLTQSQDRTSKQLYGFCRSLVQQQINNIFICCSVILEHCSVILEHNPNILEIINSESHENIISLALKNNNDGAIRAFAKYASQEDKEKIHNWGNKNPKIVKMLSA